MNTTTNTGRRVLRRAEAAAKIGMGVQTLDALRKHDPSFPRPFKISARSRILYFYEDELLSYMDACAAKSRGQ